MNEYLPCIHELYELRAHAQDGESLSELQDYGGEEAIYNVALHDPMCPHCGPRHLMRDVVKITGFFSQPRRSWPQSDKRNA